MKPILTPRQNKILSTILTAFAFYLSFKSLSIVMGLYEIETFVDLSFIVYVFLFLWFVFFYDLHLKKSPNGRFSHFFRLSHIKHLIIFFITPTLSYWSLVILLALNPFNEMIKETSVIVVTLSLVTFFWYYHEFFSRQLNRHPNQIKVLNLIKLIALFLVFASALGASWFMGDAEMQMFSLIFTSTFLLMYQAMVHYEEFNLIALMTSIGVSFVVGILALAVYYYWNFHYFSGALLLVAVYNFFWSMLHHYLSKDLTSKLFWEYLFMTLVLVSLILVSQNFAAKV